MALYSHKQPRSLKAPSRSILKKQSLRYGVPVPEFPAKGKLPRSVRREWVDRLVAARQADRERKILQYETPSKQAARIVMKFGGARELAAALRSIEALTGNPAHAEYARDPSVVYRWLKPRHMQGTGGIIPTSMIMGIKLAARCQGLVLTAEDFEP